MQGVFSNANEPPLQASSSPRLEYEYGLSKAGNQGDGGIEVLRVELRILIGH